MEERVCARERERGDITRGGERGEREREGGRDKGRGERESRERTDWKRESAINKGTRSFRRTLTKVHGHSDKKSQKHMVIRTNAHKGTHSFRHTETKVNRHAGIVTHRHRSIKNTTTNKDIDKEVYVFKSTDCELHTQSHAGIYTNKQTYGHKGLNTLRDTETEEYGYAYTTHIMSSRTETELQKHTYIQ